ncbi:MAG: hypothetical protein V3V62_11000 [bacterium]
MADEEGKVEEAGGEEAPGEEAPAEKAPEEASTEEAPAKAAAEEEAERPKLTAREIEKMNVPKLKEAALGYGGRIQGVHGMDKNQLIRTLKEINGIPLQEAKRVSKIDRAAVKGRIRTLRGGRDQAIADKDKVALKRIRQRIKALRRKLVRSA